LTAGLRPVPLGELTAIPQVPGSRISGGRFSARHGRERKDREEKGREGWMKGGRRKGDRGKGRGERRREGREWGLVSCLEGGSLRLMFIGEFAS